MAIEETLGMKIAGANSEGDIDFLRKIFLVEKKADILRVTEHAWWNYLHRSLNVPGRSQPPPETVQFYVDNGVDVNAQDGSGATPLHYAVRGRNLEAVKILLAAGADPNIKDREDLTPFDNSFGRGGMLLEVIEMLLQYGADPNVKKNNMTRLAGMNYMLDNIILNEEKRSHIKKVKQLIIKYGGVE